MGVFYTSPESTIQKHIFWIGFNACQAATLSPLFFLNPAILSRAALYTCGVVGALSYVGSTAKLYLYSDFWYSANSVFVSGTIPT
jgi:hypothetical protein